MKAALLLLVLGITPSERENLQVLKGHFEALDRIEQTIPDTTTVSLLKTKVLYEAAKIDPSIDGYDALKAASEIPDGFFTFTEIIIVASAGLAIIAMIILFQHYFSRLIEIVSLHVWNVILWLLCTGLCFLGSELGEYYLLAVIPGALGMIGCCMLTDHLYFYNIEEIDSAIALLLALIWGQWAIYYDSHFLGFISISALFVSLGFVAGHLPGITMVGFEDSKAIPRVTFAAGVLLVTNVYFAITQVTDDSWQVFQEGMGFLGPFMFFLGMLCLASKPYWRTDYGNVSMRGYVAFQMLTITACLLALWFGSVYDLKMLLGIAGTFSYLYLVDKYFEIPWRGIGWAWATLGFGGLLYGLASFAMMHPQFFFMAKT